MEKTIENKNSTSPVKKWLPIILISGLILRIFFLLVGGKYYFGTENFQVQGDTYGWMDSILNLIHHGVYTSDLEVANAAFFRPPGFAFIIGLFYLIAGGNMDTGVQLLSWSQILLDTLAIWMVFKITFQVSRQAIPALTTALLYATYPFIIVWTPVLYAESLSVFFLITSLYFITKENLQKKDLILGGLFTAFAVLTRLQCIFIIPAILLFLSNKKFDLPTLRYSILPYVLSFTLLYSLWPIRNYLFHDRLVFSQDLRVGKHWSPDYMAFMDYIFAVKTDHQPQYQQIIENKVVEWPETSYGTPQDSLLLLSTIEKFRTCGTGLSYFKFHAGLVKEPVKKDENCDEEIASNFHQLKENYMRQFPVNYYLLVPLSNLKKSLFKFSLYGDKSGAVKLAASALFLFRTFLVLVGVIIILLNYKKKWFQPNFGTLALLYFLLWYFFLCFVYRNIEIRYLLHCDILLLFPTGILIGKWIQTKSNIA